MPKLAEADRLSLKHRIVVPASPESLEGQIFGKFGAQIGEKGWHSVHLDARIDAMSQAHAAEIVRLIAKNGLAESERPIRILEIGAYAHYSVYLAASQVGGIGVAHDISPVSLSVGYDRAKSLNCHSPRFDAVAGDFHDLPFSDGYFDLVYVASSVHHTWRPWVLIGEMLRVTRRGGVVHLANEPLARSCCLYKFRGNRGDERSPFEHELSRLGLTGTVSSPYGGSRSEMLFGMVENDRIPAEIYRDALSQGASEIDWKVDPVPYINEFENWILDLPRNHSAASALVDRLQSSLSAVAKFYSVRDKLAGLLLPTPDDLWPLAYHVQQLLQNGSDGRPQDEWLCRLFGGALTSTFMKSGPSASDAMFRRPMREAHGIRYDQPKIGSLTVDLDNLMPDLSEPMVNYCFAPTDWQLISEDIQAFSNKNSIGNIFLPKEITQGVLVLRIYSVVGASPYYFSILVDGELRFTHPVSSSESYLSKLVVAPDQKVTVIMHDEDGEPLDHAPTTRIIPTFLNIETATPLVRGEPRPG